MQAASVLSSRVGIQLAASAPANTSTNNACALRADSNATPPRALLKVDSDSSCELVGFTPNPTLLQFPKSEPDASAVTHEPPVRALQRQTRLQFQAQQQNRPTTRQSARGASRSSQNTSPVPQAKRIRMTVSRTCSNIGGAGSSSRRPSLWCAQGHELHAAIVTSQMANDFLTTCDTCGNFCVVGQKTYCCDVCSWHICDVCRAVAVRGAL